MHHAKTLPGLMLGLVLAITPEINADEVTPPPADAGKTNSEVLDTYKKMSLEELMNQEVTSVAIQYPRAALIFQTTSLRLLSARRHSMLGYIFDSRTADVFET